MLHYFPLHRKPAQEDTHKLSVEFRKALGESDKKKQLEEETLLPEFLFLPYKALGKAYP